MIIRSTGFKEAQKLRAGETVWLPTEGVRAVKSARPTTVHAKPAVELWIDDNDHNVVIYLPSEQTVETVEVLHA